MPHNSPVTAITDDIYQVRLPLPFALNHVNVYLVHGSGGWTIVDCGINWQAGRDTWQITFDELGISPSNIEQIVMTHVHPDHFGLAGWLYQQAEAVDNKILVKTSPREIQQAQEIWGTERINFGAWLARNGMPDKMAEQVNQSLGDTVAMTLPHPPPITAILSDEILKLGDRDFRMIHAPGHSDGQVIFYDEADKLMLSGDHVLMKITPNIGLWEQSDPNPLGDYIQSLQSLRELDVRLALPGHRRLIEDWTGRIDQLLAHHQERLSHVIDGIEQGLRTPYEVTNHIFEIDRFSAHEWRFAVAETLSHLEYLRVQGKIQQDDKQIVFTL